MRVLAVEGPAWVEKCVRGSQRVVHEDRQALWVWPLCRREAEGGADRAAEYLEYSGLLRFAAGCGGLDFMTMLKIGLEANSGVLYREGPWPQPVFPYDEEEIDAIFEENGLIPGRTVLLAPYAGKSDMRGIPMSFYIKLAEQLRAVGYTVCTNTGRAKEPPVPGTVPLLVPYRLARRFCEKAGSFVSIRSGLCDIVSSAECKKVVLYGNAVFMSAAASQKEFYSLNSMGLCDDTVEIDYMTCRQTCIFQSIIENLK